MTHALYDVSGFVIEQLGGLINENWPEGIRRMVMIEAFSAIERVKA